MSAKATVRILLVGLVAALISGCGSASSSTATTAAATCASGYELYYGTCVLESSLTTVTTTTTGACLSLADSIPFYGTGVTVDSSGDLFAGVIPDLSTYGSTTVDSSTTASGTSYSGNNTYYGGALALDVASSSGIVSGTLTISSYEREVIEEEASSSEYASATYDSAPCVSGIALQGQIYTGSTNRFSGYVYLYLNQTSHGVVLSF